MLFQFYCKHPCFVNYDITLIILNIYMRTPLQEQSTITTRDHRIKRDLKLDPKESTLHPKESTLDPIESTPDTIQCRKVEREWDKGKSTLGSK